ncbi:MAG: carboxynorspermidine decarboxylase [Elusimicrobia bacterium]|nr:carboxynorspermidine decarboxylase [Elusimicrobiota bacterium]
MVHEHRASLPTPYYLIDEARLLNNLKKIERVRERSGAKAVLALKCFSTWAVFDLMRPYLDGTTSSSLYEARLGHEKFGKEVHAYSVAFSDDEVDAVRRFATKVIFNSVSQLNRFYPAVKTLPVGLRINPGVSHSHFDLADPARRHSRLGASSLDELREAAPLLNGTMFHMNCENDDFEKFSALLDHIGRRYEFLLERLDWVSLGGGIYFTKEGYPLDAFCEKLKDFARRFDVRLYLEPGETAITSSGFLVTRVLDIVHNEMDIAVVDAAVETHMLDLLIYQTPAKMEGAAKEGPVYMVAGRTCLAGDIFGTYAFPEKLQVGSLIPIADAAGYTMVKKNWFNGIPMPSIVVRRLDGRMETVKRFTYDDYLNSLS